MPVAPLTARPFDLLVVLFLVSHIFVTVFVDSQAVFPKEWYPQWAQDVNTWYLTTYKDPLMTQLPPWFRVLVLSEVVLQLPFFFVGAYAFAKGASWIRIPAIVYGLTTAMTLVPILGEFALAPGEFNRGMLFAFYTPYLLVPAAIAWRMLAREAPFERVPPSRKKRV